MSLPSDVYAQVCYQSVTDLSDRDKSNKLEFLNFIDVTVTSL